MKFDEESRIFLVEKQSAKPSATWANGNSLCLFFEELKARPLLALIDVRARSAWRI
jgi:hypothetical protein